jgi:1-acyl-sn-glycerol-3-phosphate acyltransferase
MNLYTIYLNTKLVLIVLLFLINTAQYSIFPIYVSRLIYIYIFNMALSLTNSKITIHGNPELFKQNNLIIMSNHYAGLDFGILTDLYYRNNRENVLYTIAKSNLLGDNEDKSVISKMMYYVKDSYMASKYLIPYIRGDKEDGAMVKNKVTGYLEQNANIMVFPEGTTSKNGVPKDFKSGIFKLAVEKKINILPITIKYKKDIGSIIGEPLRFLNWFDNDVDIYIHDIITTEDECYKDYTELKEKVFTTIVGGSTPQPPVGGC